MRSVAVKRLAADLPGYDLIHTYYAAIPFYECDIEARLLMRHELSALQQFGLACIAKGIDTVDGIDVVLGAGRGAIAAALATLLGTDLILPSGNPSASRRFVTTEKGTDALLEAGWRKPEATTLRVLYDGITGEVLAPNRLAYVGGAEAAKLGLHFVPARCKPPTLSDVSPGEMRRTLKEMRRLDQRRTPDGELHDIIRVTARRPMYRACEVAVFQAADGPLVFRVTDRGKRLPQYEDALGGMAAEVPEVLPFERAEVVGALPSEMSPLIPRDLIARADQLEEEREQLKAIAELEEDAAPASSAHEEPGQQPTPTRAELELVRARLAEVERELSSVRHVSTQEHRELLEKALKHARKRVIVVSPWLEPAAVDDDLQKLLRRAIEKGVEIVIGWGMPPNREETGAKRDERSLHTLRQLERLARDTKEAAERRRREQDARVEQLRRLGKVEIASGAAVRADIGRLKVVRLGDTHEKILIADTRFAVVTSFNFLSFRGDPKRGFRRETGIYYEVKAKIEELAQDVLARIRRVEEAVLPGDRDTLLDV